MDISAQTQSIVADIWILGFCFLLILWTNLRVDRIQKKLKAIVTFCKYHDCPYNKDDSSKTPKDRILKRSGIVESDNMCDIYNKENNRYGGKDNTKCQVKLNRGCYNQRGFTTFQCLCYIMAGLAAIVSALCFASLVMLNPAVGMPIVGAITALAFFMAVRSKPATKATNKDTDDSDKGGTNGIPSEKVSKKTSTIRGTYNEVDENNNSNQESNNSDDNVNCTHIHPPIRNNKSRGCYHSIHDGRMTLCSLLNFSNSCSLSSSLHLLLRYYIHIYARYLIQIYATLTYIGVRYGVML